MSHMPMGNRLKSHYAEIATKIDRLNTASQSKLKSIYIDTKSLSAFWVWQAWDSIWMEKFRFTFVKFNSPEAFPFDEIFL